MNAFSIVLQGHAFTLQQPLAALGGAALLLVALLFALARRRARRRDAERQREMDARIAALAQSSAELNGRLGRTAIGWARARPIWRG